MSLLAAGAAPSSIDHAVSAAHTAEADERPGADASSREQAPAALLLLREVRHPLAGWEPTLIEAARAAGASRADPAHPLGVTSRQAAARRYVRLRPGDVGTTAEQRVKATRDRRADEPTTAPSPHGPAATRPSCADSPARSPP